MSRLLHLFPILGRRAALTFGLVTFLIAALLATVNITSRYALKLYVEDQLQRIPWDAAVYQRGTARDGGVALRQQLAAVRELGRVENLVFLRARFPEGSDVVSEVGGKPLTAPWLCLLSASDPSILPPGLGLGGGVSTTPASMSEPAGILALIGPERAMGGAFRALQGAKDFTFKVTSGHHERLVFNTPLRGVVRLDRDELNRWLMDQTGSVSYVPHVGVVLLAPYSNDILTNFDRAATGLLSMETHGQGDGDMGHIQTAEYEPELVYLIKLNREGLISGWDIPGSLERVSSVLDQVDRASHRVLDRASNESRYEIRLAHEVAAGSEEDVPREFGFTVDSTTLVLLGRMDRIAKLLGAVTLLVALPLLWMGWVVAANLSGLLMLNERRTLGLLRLRGIEGRLIGRTLLVAVLGGGLVGGVLGLIAGSVGPLLVYEGGSLPAGVLGDRQQIGLLLLFLVVTLVLAVLVSSRLIRYATTISPLEASRRVASSEVTRASLRFGVLQFLALALGLYVMVGDWVLQNSLSRHVDQPWALWTDRLLAFVGLPLFLYGLTTLLASHRELVQRVMEPLVRPLGGSLGRLALRHVAVKPHRTMAFLLIVALMGSVSLYPTITSRSFADRAERGARVQLGAHWQILFNAPDLVDVSRLRGGMREQLGALQPEIEKILTTIKAQPGVRDATYMVETLLPNFYLPGYGLRGVPLYLLGDPGAYRRMVYAEPEVGISAPYDAVVSPLADGQVAMSPPVAEFWQVTPGASLLMGLGTQRDTLSAKVSGTLAFLPGLPPRTVTDRQGYVQARVDYLNHLFNSQAYVVTAGTGTTLEQLQLLVSRVIVLVDGADLDTVMFERTLRTSLGVPVLETHHLAQEVSKVGTDMYISLALANMRIYLIGGLILAAIAILAVAMANYVEDRRTLALLRIRGAAPVQLWRFIVSLLLSPALLGLVIGGLAALLAGYGLASYVWRLREIRTVVQLLPTRIVPSSATLLVLLTIVALLAAVASGFSWWAFRRTAHQKAQVG